MLRAGRIGILLLCVALVAGWAQARRVERPRARAGAPGRRGMASGPGRATEPPRSMPAREVPSPPTGVVRRVQTQERVVALTFDDGPDPRYTPRVLSLLRARGARATFFMIGRNVEQYPELARRVVAEGHAIGNHTWNHEVMVGHTGSWNLDEIRRCDEEIRAACGRRSRLLRPPKGRSDERTLQAARATGHRVILWTVAVENHSARTPEEMAERVLSRVEPGAIILCHDGEPGHPISRERTMRALPLVVDGLQRRGYGFVTVPELLALGEARAR